MFIEPASRYFKAAPLSEILACSELQPGSLLLRGDVLEQLILIISVSTTGGPWISSSHGREVLLGCDLEVA